MKLKYQVGLAAAIFAAAPAAAQITTTSNTDATQLGTALQGSGINFTSATRTGDAGIGTFSGGLAGVGIDRGVVLTTGTLGCVGAVNDSASCGSGDTSTGNTLTFSFTANSASLFFNYVFASEEYNRFVGSTFNDVFSLTLNGANYSNVNLATLPNGEVVSINNVNPLTNAAFYRNNSDEQINETGPTYPSLNLPIQYDGLTTVLTASATNLLVGSLYTLSFAITDIGDRNFDSAVFIQGGSVGVVTPPVESAVPEPASWAMMIFGFGVVGGAMRRRTTRTLAAA